MKSFKLLVKFIWYCLNHRDERFWQALRNCSGFDYIYVSDNFINCEKCEVIDTFYSESFKKNKEISAKEVQSDVNEAIHEIRKKKCKHDWQQIGKYFDELGHKILMDNCIKCGRTRFR